MKRLIFFTLAIIMSLGAISQTQVRAAEIVADERLFPPLRDTTTTPKRVGELRVRQSDTSLYMAISMTAPKKWQKVLKLTDMTSENIYTINGILSGNRTLTGLNNTRSLTFDSLNSFLVRRNNITRLEINSGISRLSSPAGDAYVYAITGEAGLWNDNSNVIVHNDDSISFNSLGSVYQFRNIPYNSSTDLINLVYDSTNGRFYRQVSSGGGGEVNTASNLAGTGVGIFKDKAGVDLRFKKLIAGDGIAITDMTDSVRITSVIDINNNDEWYPYKADVGNPSNAFLWRNASGAGAAANTQGDVFLGWMNSATYQTGTTSSGLAYTHHGNNSLVQPISLSSSARYSVRFKVRLEDQSNGTETYKVWGGFADDHTFGAPVDACYFTYTDADSSGQWVCKVVNNSAVTAVASGVTVAADTDYILELTVIGGTAYFYINKVFIVGIGGVPDDDLARVTSINLCIRKSAGTTSRKMYLEDFWYGRKSQ